MTRSKQAAAPWVEADEVLNALDRVVADGRNSAVLGLIREIIAALASDSSSDLSADLQRAAERGPDSFDRLKGPAIGALGLRIVALNRVVYPALLRSVDEVARGDVAAATVDLAIAARGLAHIVEHSDVRDLVDGARRRRMAGGSLRERRTAKTWDAIDPVLRDVLKQYGSKPRTFQRDAAMKQIEKEGIQDAPADDAVYRRLGILARQKT